MHMAVQNYVFKTFHQWRAEGNTSKLDVLEIGSLDINGSIKSIFTPFSNSYLGLDVQEGPGVDLVADATEYIKPEAYDVIVCCEVFEHLEEWKKVVYNSYMNLKIGGVFIGTCAGEGRRPHSAIDANEIRNHEYYQNVGAWNMTQTLTKAGFNEVMTVTELADLQWTAIK